jgi:hypothetical protein
MAAVVAAAWATIAGWMRIVGHVTPVPTDIRPVVCAIAPRTDHAKAESPCRSVQGWKWSDNIAKSKPASSARRALRTSAAGGCSSHESA